VKILESQRAAPRHVRGDALGIFRRAMKPEHRLEARGVDGFCNKNFSPTDVFSRWGERENGMKVLLVDDHVLIRDAMRGVLKELTEVRNFIHRARVG
jgi:hypothetical protein